MGVGDAVRAQSWGTSALFYNPAGMSRVRAYILEAGYHYQDPRDGHTFTAAAVDGKTNPFVTLGTAYSFISSKPGGVDRDGHQFRGAVSTQYRSNDFAIFAGIGARYLELDYGGGSANDVDDWTVDVGLVMDLGNRIKFGVVGANLVDTGSIEAPRKIGVGAAFNFQAFEASADLDIKLGDLTDTAGAEVEGDVLSYAFGARYVVGEAIRISVGLVVDEVSSTERITAGFGYASTTWSLDVGYSAALEDDTLPLVSVSIRYLPPYQP